MTLRLATEVELTQLYPDLEVGAMPPFGAAYGHRVFVERCLVGEPEMVFNAGTHTGAIRMHCWEATPDRSVRVQLDPPCGGNACQAESTSGGGRGS